MMILMNVVSFYEMYAGQIKTSKLKTDNILDQWIVSELQALIGRVTGAMEKYDLNEAIRPVGDFVIDLSTWYLRRSRDRFKSADEKDKAAALTTLGYVLLELSKVLAPFTPFIAETIYKKMGGKKESVHLEEWPETEKINQELLVDMARARQIASLGLEARAKAGIAVRQPLGAITVIGGKLSDELQEILKDELNIKEVRFAKGENLSVELSTEITPELKLEGLKRELTRHINALRKDAGLTIADRIVLHYETADEEIKKVFTEFNKDILTGTLSKEIIAGHIPTENERELTLGSAKVWIGF
jgi:isoleucyl-tRNA synthetase